MTVHPDATEPVTVAGDRTSIRFTEEMKGYVALHESDFAVGRDVGRSEGNFCMFHLTIEIPDIDQFLHDDLRRGACQGWVGADVLGGKLPVERGWFNLFVDDELEVGRKWMRYRLWFRDGAGHPLTLVGFKDVRDDAGFDVWSDTSTLFVRILAGHVDETHDADARVVAAGILDIWIRDFVKQLTTFRTTGPTVSDRVRAMRVFGSTFLAQLGQVYVCARHGSRATPPGGTHTEGTTTEQASG
jgi:cholesterol oxidase